MSQSIVPFINLRSNKSFDHELPSWIVQQKELSWQDFCQIGLPNRKNPSWKYSNLSFLNRTTYNKAKVNLANIDVHSLKKENSINILFYHGKLLFKESDLHDLQAGLKILPIFEAYKTQDKKIQQNLLSLDADFKKESFIKLTQALHDDGLYIEVAPGYKIDKPLNMVYIIENQTNTPVASFPYSMIHVEEKSSIIIHENLVELKSPAEKSSNEHFSNKCLDIILSKNAHLSLVHTQNLSPMIHSLNHTRVLQYEHSTFESHTLNAGGQYTRNTMNVKQVENFASTKLNGLFLGKNEQQCDMNTTIEHLGSHGLSDQVYKGVLTDKAKGIFLGNIKVAKETEKNNSKQLNKNLLLTPQAEINSTPQLEIDTSDVKCAHGSTVSQIRGEEILYLMSRGIRKKEAIKILSNAFTNEIIQKLPDLETKKMWASVVSKLHMT